MSRAIVKAPCPGPGLGHKTCPQGNRGGLKGGRCKECTWIAKRAAADAWARRNPKKDRFRKANVPESERQEIHRARLSSVDPVGLKGALSVILAMQRAAS